MIIYVDIDETICEYNSKREYELATPIPKNIEKINQLYDEGHYIKYWSARGSSTNINWFKITKEQLDSWGCKYHEVSTGEKPEYDLLICDKSKRINEL